MKHVQLSTCLAGLLLLPLGSAFAGWQADTGMQCKPLYSSSGYGPHNWSGIKYTGSSNAWFVCPVHKDDTANDNTYYLRVHHPTSRTTECYYNRQNWSGGTTTWSVASTTGSGDRGITISPPGGTYGLWDSNMALCLLDSGTSIRQTTWQK